MSSIRYISKIFACTVLGIILPGSLLAAPLTNGDFSAGFDAWSGEVTDIFFTTTPVDPLPGAFVGNYDASSGEAVLTTTTFVDDILSVILVQGFDVGSVTAGNSLVLSYDLSVVLTSVTDLALAQLSFGGGSAIDLLGGSSVDITTLAGQTVELLFGVEDFDDLADTLSVDNIVITEVIAPAPAPVPGSLPLLMLGLAGFVVMRRKTA